MTKIVPVSDHIVIEPVADEVKSESGIIIPDTASKERPMKGLVLAVGPGKLTDDGKRKEMEVKVGDIVLFTKYGPTEVKIDGKEILILTMADVMGRVEA